MLVSNTYGKGRVRILRLYRTSERHEVRELTVQPMLTGDFAQAYTKGDNSTSVSTDTMKNLVNIVAREHPGLDTEAFCAAVCARFLERYPQVSGVTTTAHETKWVRMMVDGQPHPHGFVLDANGKPLARVEATRAGHTTSSGIDGFTFMKTTQSGWDGFAKDSYTTIKETRNRIAATAMQATWRWTRDPADFGAANATVLRTMLDVFATTFSESVQDSLYRMAMAALAAVPEIETISLACPNKHYLLVNLAPVRADQRERRLPADRRAARADRVHGRARLIHRPTQPASLPRPARRNRSSGVALRMRTSGSCGPRAHHASRGCGALR